MSPLHPTVGFGLSATRRGLLAAGIAKHPLGVIGASVTNA